MNQDLSERGATSIVTRRTVMKTGVKLAYAAPLVAASFKLSGLSALAVSCDTCDNDLSTKPLEGGCYTCKAAASNCNTTQGSTQVDDLYPDIDGSGLYCYCNSANCKVNGADYTQGQTISDGVCHPVDVSGTSVCGGTGGPSPA